ncbi:MAG: methylated-DNA--[protein]-cysteine S-methyltransferase [Rhodocyclaceae bacterium]|nr:methylated-DNA--[protein]-cysteine S-methyltransferase [Rhodocyclaceae bacterium]
MKTSDRATELIASACRRIEAADGPLSLAELAGAAGLSQYHFHRLFKAATGVTPKAYAQAHRTGQLQKTLANGASVTEAIYASGFDSNTAFYDKSAAMLGMKPSRFRRGGVSETLRFALGQCSLGAIIVAATDKGICHIAINDDPEALLRELQDRFPKAELIGDDPEFDAWIAQVIGFVEAPAIGLDLPLDIRGTAFQQRVWQALRSIPAGSIVSYTDVAAHLGLPRAVRAVAGACAANTLAVAIPCHRVLRSDGALSGYRWGLERKQALLQREHRPQLPEALRTPANEHLVASDPVWFGLICKVGACELRPESHSDRTKRSPYEALMRSIAYQQIHGRAADAILGRFLALFPGQAFPEPAAVLALDEAAMRACGFSAAKTSTMRGIAEAALEGIVPSRAAADQLGDEELIERLTGLRGVGRWTVEMLLMFTLLRPDVLPIDDFGVREGWKVLKGLERQPKPRELAEIGRPWAPYRSTAAWYLWRALELSRKK